MAKISHCFWYMRVGGVERNFLRTLPRFMENEPHQHELILFESYGKLMSEIPDYWTVHILNDKNKLDHAYQLFGETDVVHLYPITKSVFFRTIGYLANRPQIDNIRNMMSCPDPHQVEYIGVGAKAIAKLQTAPSKVRIIPNGVDFDPEATPDLSKFSAGTPPVLIEVGRPDKRRSVRAEEFVPELHEQYPDLTCHVVGREGEDGNGILYHGLVEDPTPLYREAHFLVHYPEIEPFGMTVPEAYFHGVIPVVSGKGGIRELVEHEVTGYYLDVPTPEQIRNQLQLVLDQYKQDPQFWRPMAKKGFERLKDRYHIDHFIEGYEQLYGELEGKRGADFPEFEWTSSFSDFFEQASIPKLEPSTAEIHQGEFTNVQERDWTRLWKTEKLLDSAPKRALDVLDGLESNSFCSDFKHYDLRTKIQNLLGNHEQAVEAARQAIECNPEIADPYLDGTEAFVQLGDIEQAYRFLSKFEQYTTDELNPIKDTLNKLESVRP